MKLSEDRKSTTGLRKLSLQQYIHILDRFFDQKKFSPKERDAIFNDPDNIELISKAYEKGVHPSKLIKNISTDPVDMMYASNESLVMESLRELTPGQKYAVNLLEPMGLNLVSNEKQLKNGTLVFTAGDEIYWGIFKTGYVRKLDKSDPPMFGAARWQIVYYDKDNTSGITEIDDDSEYMELAQILSEKIRKARNKKSYRVSYVNKIYKGLNKKIEDMKEFHQYGPIFNPSNEEIILGIEKLLNKYKK